MGRSAIGIVPRSILAINYLDRFLIPELQLNQRVEPSVDVPARYVRPQVPNLLLASTPDLFRVVKELLDRPAASYCLQDLLDAHVPIGAKVGCRFSTLETQDHHPDRFIRDACCCQERFVLSNHFDASAQIADRLPSILVFGSLREVNSVKTILARTASLFGLRLWRKIKEFCVASKATNNRYLQFVQR